jgi:hypothetical protein
LPFWGAYGLWVAFTFVVIGTSTYLWARMLGWRFPRVVAVLASVSTIAFINYDLGQVAAVAVGFLVAVLLTSRAGRLGWAGALAMTGALLLPQDLWPLVPLMWIVPRTMDPGGWRRVLFGQAMAFVALIGWSLLMHGGLLSGWVHILLHFGAKPAFPIELVGISGLVTLAPSSWHLSAGLGDPLVSLVAITGVVAATVLVRWLLRSPGMAHLSRTRRTGWLILLPLGIWLIATPYGHVQDVAAVFPLTMLVLGEKGTVLRSVSGWVALISVLVVPVALTFFSPYFFPVYTLAPLGLLILVGVAWVALRRELAEVQRSAIRDPRPARTPAPMPRAG